MDITNEDIEFYYNKARNLALKKVEQLARKILVEHEDMDQFVMANGDYFFTYKGSRQKWLPSHVNKLDSDYKYYKEDAEPFLITLNSFLDKWKVLELAGNPMRFTATGQRISDW